MSRFSSNGSPTCTARALVGVGLLVGKPADASTLTPPMPSRPVVEPSSTARLPTPVAWPSTRRSVGRTPEAQHVDERVARVGLVEDGLAADGGHADRVAVAGDAADDALGDPTAAGVVERAEAQRIHQGDRAGAHGEDVAEDAARPRWPRPGRARWPTGGCGSRCGWRRRCRRRRRRRRRSRPGPTSTHGRLGRQPLQVDARRLVGAVLGPHHRVHGQLEVVGRPTEDAHDLAGLVVGEARVRGGCRSSAPSPDGTGARYPSTRSRSGDGHPRAPSRPSAANRRTIGTVRTSPELACTIAHRRGSCGCTDRHGTAKRTKTRPCPTSTRRRSPRVGPRVGPSATTSRRSRPTSPSGAASAPPNRSQKRLRPDRERDRRRRPAQAPRARPGAHGPRGRARRSHGRHGRPDRARSRLRRVGAKAYGERKGITYAAWREARRRRPATLKAAGISRSS